MSQRQETDEALRAFVLKTLERSSQATGDEVLASWRVHRGVPIEAEEADRVAAAYELAGGSRSRAQSVQYDIAGFTIAQANDRLVLTSARMTRGSMGSIILFALVASSALVAIGSVTLRLQIDLIGHLGVTVAMLAPLVYILILGRRSWGRRFLFDRAQDRFFNGDKVVCPMSRIRAVQFELHDTNWSLLLALSALMRPRQAEPDYLAVLFETPGRENQVYRLTVIDSSRRMPCGWGRWWQGSWEWRCCLRPGNGQRRRHPRQTTRNGYRSLTVVARGSGDGRPRRGPSRKGKSTIFTACGRPSERVAP